MATRTGKKESTDFLPRPTVISPDIRFLPCVARVVRGATLWPRGSQRSASRQVFAVPHRRINNRPEASQNSYLLWGWAKIAAALVVSQRTARRYMRNRGLPVGRIGGSYVTSYGLLDRWLLTQIPGRGRRAPGQPWAKRQADQLPSLRPGAIAATSAVEHAPSD